MSVTSPHVGADNTDFLTCAEVAAKFRVKPAQVADYCRSGELRAYRPKRAWLIAPNDLQDFLDRHANRPASTEGAA